MPTTASAPLAADPALLPSNRRGLPLTTSPKAAARYRDAIDRVYAGQAGATELLDEAVACDPAFAVAHAARWMEANAAGDKHAARLARDAALAHLEGVTEWERSHVECMTAMVDRTPEARERVRRHLVEHPLDLLVATQLVGDLFFHGGRGKRQAVLDVLLPLAPHHDDDWAFNARLGFHLSERGDPGRAITILEAALRARPDAPFVAHALAHALLESGDRAASHRFLLDWTSQHSHAGPLDGHIQWHLSLGELESGEPAAAVDRYLRCSAPGTSHCALGLLLADAAGLFCRMALDGAPLDGMPRAELRALLARLGGAAKIPFVAVHVAALALALGDEDALALLEAMATVEGRSHADPAAIVVSAFEAYVAGDARACVDALEQDRTRAWEALGGSNEERALIEKLYATAARTGASRAPTQR